MKIEISEKIRHIIEALFLLFFLILIEWIAFSAFPVHAAESSEWSLFTNVADKTIDLNDGTVRMRFYADDTNFFYAYIFTETTYGDSKQVLSYKFDLSKKTVVQGGISTERFSYNAKNDSWSIVATSTGGSSFYYDSSTFDLDEICFPFFDSLTSFSNYCLTGDKSGMISEPKIPDLTDEAYTFTGFTMNGKTASWTGTTQRSNLLDQDVEEYTTFTYGFASSEDQTVSNFIEYAGEYATADKKLKLPWDELEANKKDGEFIRQVNIVPSYRVPGAFYHGVGAKVYFHKDGSIDKVVMDTKRTDLNTGNMVYDSSLGYLQNVIYTEEKTHDGKGRQATFKWSTQKSLPEDAQVEIVAQNFYIEWFNKKTQENFVYKEYGEDCIYSTGSYSFNANTPVWTWLKEKEIDPFSIKTQSYGTTEYYLRIVTYDETDLKYHYGGWVRVDIKEKTATRVPSTDVETGDFDDIDGLWKQDTTSDDSYHYSTDDEGKLTGNIDVNSWEDLNMNSFTWLFRNLQSMVSSLGEFPNMITSVFGFLPVQFVTALGVFLVAIVLLRFLGR